MSKKKLLKSTNLDPETEAAEQVVEMEQAEKDAAEREQINRENLIAQTYRMMGRIEATDFMTKIGNVSSLMHLKEVKESKVYKEIPHIGTWENFCNHLGKSRRLIDEQLANLETFGQEFLETVSSFKIGYRELKKLRKSVSDGQILIEDKSIRIAEESIPLDPDYKEDLEAAIETLLEAKDKKLEETEAELKAQKRIAAEKTRVINKQEKELSKFEKKLNERDFKPGEEEFLQEMENLKTTLVGMELKLDPENLPDDATSLMKSAYLSTLEYFRRTAQAYYDTATELFGIDGDVEWEQPSA